MFTITPQDRAQDREQYIMIDDCCIKDRLKKSVNFLMRKPLTEAEALLLCIYYFLLTLLIFGCIIKYRLTVRWLEWSTGDCISPTFILHINIFVNITIVVQIVENTKDLVHAFICKCDYRQHPELEQHSD